MSQQDKGKLKFVFVSDQQMICVSLQAYILNNLQKPELLLLKQCVVVELDLHPESFQCCIKFSPFLACLWHPGIHIHLNQSPTLKTSTRKKNCQVINITQFIAYKLQSFGSQPYEYLEQHQDIKAIYLIKINFIAVFMVLGAHKYQVNSQLSGTHGRSVNPSFSVSPIPVKVRLCLFIS